MCVIITPLENRFEQAHGKIRIRSALTLQLRALRDSGSYVNLGAKLARD